MSHCRHLMVTPILQRATCDNMDTPGQSVTSSSSYSNFLEVKAGMLEVRRFPGIGFSSCAAPTFSHVQGISTGGYKLGFRNAPEWRMHTGMIPGMSMKMREAEVQSLCSLEVHRMRE